MVDTYKITHPDRELVGTTEGDLYGEWDPERVQQLLGNLVNNALAHGAQDQPITMRVRPASQTHIIMDVSNGGDVIPPDTLDRIFEPLFRGKVENAAPRTRHLGIGLFIVKKIVEAYGGTISVTSAESGTCFTTVLPYRSPQAASPLTH